MNALPGPERGSALPVALAKAALRLVGGSDFADAITDLTGLGKRRLAQLVNEAARAVQVQPGELRELGQYDRDAAETLVTDLFVAAAHGTADDRRQLPVAALTDYTALTEYLQTQVGINIAARTRGWSDDGCAYYQGLLAVVCALTVTWYYEDVAANRHATTAALGQLLRSSEAMLARIDRISELSVSAGATAKNAPARDGDGLRNIRVGVTRQSLEERLNITEGFANGYSKTKREGKKVRLENLVYTLDAVFVEAFLTRDGVVRALTVTARTPEPVHVDLAGMNVTLNSDTFSQAQIPHVSHVVSAYQRSGALWEVSEGMSTVMQNTARAVGWTCAGASSSLSGYHDFLEATAILKAQIGEPAELGRQEGGFHHVWEVTWSAYYDHAALPRERFMVNAIAATYPGFEWFPELVGLHGDTTGQLGQKPTGSHAQESR